jgi:hypothetical protein
MPTCLVPWTSQVNLPNTINYLQIHNQSASPLSPREATCVHKFLLTLCDRIRGWKVLFESSFDLSLDTRQRFGWIKLGSIRNYFYRCFATLVLCCILAAGDEITSYACLKRKTFLSLISDFRRGVDEIRSRLGYYFGVVWHIIVYSWPFDSWCCPETSVNNYHTIPRNIPEECRSHFWVAVHKGLHFIFAFLFLSC